MRRLFLHAFFKVILAVCSILLFPAANVSAQEVLPFNEESGKYFYAKVIFVDSTSKEELYQRAVTWFHNHFESENPALTIEDIATGKISGAGVTKLLIKSGGFENEVPMYFTLTINVKGNRCKFEFTDIVYSADGGKITAEKKLSGKLNTAEKQYLSRTKKAIVALEKSLVSAITNNKEAPVVRKYK
ncbi:MAG: DUF4468 domain-containing protein [Bacteroidia bacterium]